MPIRTDALVLKENNNIGEADRFVTLLTRELGVVRASVRGAQRIRSRLGPATRALTYSSLTLTEGRDKYIVTEAQPQRVFWDLHAMDKLALSQYFCELCLTLAPREEPAPEILRLMLNSLHFLGDGSREPRLIKALTEWRLLCGAGYAPDLSGCRRCGTAEGTLLLCPREGTLCCPACAQPPGAVPLSPAARAILRHFAAAPLEKCYAVRPAETELAQLAQAAEQLLLAQVGRGFRTLDFYKTIV